MSETSVAFTIRPVTVDEKAADDACYNCGAEVAYLVEPQNVTICAACAQTDLAVHLGARATPVQAYLPGGLTGEQRALVASMTIPPAGIKFRSLVSVSLQPLDSGHRRRRVTIEYDVPEGEPV